MIQLQENVMDSADNIFRLRRVWIHAARTMTAEATMLSVAPGLIFPLLMTHGTFYRLGTMF